MNGSLGSEAFNPFPGLRPFLEEEEYLFFGREHQVDTLVDTLAAQHFLAVVGYSGSGKSSLVNCGLRPALRKGLMASAGTAWRMVQFRPGGRPITAMARALAKDGVLYQDYKAKRDLSLDKIIDTTLRMSKLGLVDVFQQACLPEDVNLLVVVDQFEELFRFRQPDAEQPLLDPGVTEEAMAFVNLLLEVREQSVCPIFVVLTMRSDFLGDCSRFAGLAEAINRGQYLVPRMTREERRQAIVAPVHVGGADITPALVSRLVNDVGDNPDQLSILQHALNRTWAYWKETTGGQGPLDLAHYEAIGTMNTALDAHAEQAFADLATPRQRELCERIFRALTDKATDPRGVRRPTPLKMLCSLADASADELIEVMDRFRLPGRSFLMPLAGERLECDTVIDLSHESLMRVWRRLDEWAEEEARSARAFQRLAEAAMLHAQGRAGLWRDPDLQLALRWREENRPNEAWASRYHPGFGAAMAFLDRSEQAFRHEQAERERQRRSTMASLGGLTALAVVAGGYAWWQLQVAERAQAEAFAATAKALLASDPLAAVVNSLAAMGELAHDPGASIPLSDTLSRALLLNWEVGSIQTGQGRVRSLLTLPNGELISGGADGTLRRWRQGQAVGSPLPTGQGAVRSLVAMKTGELVSGGADGTLRTWRDGRAVGSPIQTAQGVVSSLVVLNTGELISGGADGSLRRWRAGRARGEPIRTGQGWIHSLAVLGNGDLISGGDEGTLRRWREGRPVGPPIPTGQDGVHSLVVLKNGELISVGGDGSLRRWRGGREVRPPMPPLQGQVRSVLALRNGDLISGGENGTLQRWHEGKPVGPPIQVGQGPVLHLVELADGELISTGLMGRLRRLREGRAVETPIPTGQGRVLSLAVLPNGDLISGGDDGSLRGWRDGKATGPPIRTGKGPVRGLVALKNGDLLSGGDDGRLWRWRRGKVVPPSTLTGQGTVQSLTAFRNGEVISGGADGTVRRWRDGKAVGKPIRTGQGRIWSLATLGERELISGGSKDGLLLRWRDGLPEGQPIHTGLDEVRSLVGLPNGELISGGEDGNLRRWRDGEALGHPIQTGQDWVLSLAVLGNGQLVSGGGDGTLRWVRPQSVIRAACHELREHPALLSPRTAAERQASATCRRRGRWRNQE